MYEFTCAMCGKQVSVLKRSKIRKFCGKKCYGASLRTRTYKCNDDEPVMPPRTHIHPAGYDNLLRAIVRQAREDVMNYKPDNWIRQDAEHFFLSEYFEQLTNLDGFKILYKLNEMYEARQKQKGATA